MGGSAGQKDVAVCYLARAAEGLPAFRRFLDSYRRQPAGHPHDLVVIYKGFETETALWQARDLFRDVESRAVYCDDQRFDIGAYAIAAEMLEHEYICLLNTHSELLAPDWLAFLHAAIVQPGVGLAGATASYESLRTSAALVAKAVWLVAVLREPYYPDLAEHFGFALSVYAPDWMLQKPRSPLLGGWRSHGQFHAHSIQTQWEEYWRSVTQPDQRYGYLRDHPPFPHAHVRTNGFIVRRETYAKLGSRVGNTKESAYNFESGYDSFSARIVGSGQRLLLVDREGKQYEAADWPRSRTLRLDDQSGLLISDNQTRAYSKVSPAEQRSQTLMTWGYAGVKRHEVCSLGFNFSGNPSGNIEESLPHIIDHAEYGVRSQWTATSPSPIDMAMIPERAELSFWP